MLQGDLDYFSWQRQKKQFDLSFMEECRAYFLEIPQGKSQEDSTSKGLLSIYR
ncbi:uncharacterized protein METZ01_LOCUS513539, partial [marine metagenome]